MAKPKIPADIADALSHASARACCICRREHQPVQIHHIDNDDTNNAPENLALLCKAHHDEAHTRVPFTQSLRSGVIQRFRNEWHDHVAACHATGRSPFGPSREPTTSAAGAPSHVTIVNYGDFTGPVGGTVRDSPVTTSSAKRRPRKLSLAASVAVAVAGLLVLVLVRSALIDPTKLPVDAPATPTVADRGPRQFKAEDHGTFVELKWAAGGDDTAAYVLAYAPEGGEAKLVDIDRDRTRQVVSDLDVATPYCFRLWAILVRPDGTEVKAWADAAVRGCKADPPAVPDDQASVVATEPTVPPGR